MHLEACKGQVHMKLLLTLARHIVGRPDGAGDGGLVTLPGLAGEGVGGVAVHAGPGAYKGEGGGVQEPFLAFGQVWPH